jgi:hypothetical protein
MSEVYAGTNAEAGSAASGSGLSPDQVVAGAAVRYVGCAHSTDAWSKGAR